MTVVLYKSFFDNLEQNCINPALTYANYINISKTGLQNIRKDKTIVTYYNYTNGRLLDASIDTST